MSEMYCVYIESMKESKERDPLRLFVSDLGKCPRMIGYRMSGTEPDYISKQAFINKQIMFDTAEHIETMLTQALENEGLLIGSQVDVEFDGARENWGGRCDIMADYNGRRIIEVKTTHPGAFKFDLDYPEHHLQAACYDLYMGDKWQLDAPPMLVYFDRGGQNTPVEKIVEVRTDNLLREMDKLEMVRDLMPDLLDKLPKVLKLRSYKKEIKLEPDYRCGYCDYRETCKPLEGTETWASRPNANVPFTPSKKADPEKVVEFCNSILEDIL